jgi:hypothetical protein
VSFFLAKRDTNAPLREAMAIKRERWRAKRAAIEGAKQKKPARRPSNSRAASSLADAARDADRQLADIARTAPRRPGRAVAPKVKTRPKPPPPEQQPPKKSSAVTLGGLGIWLIPPPPTLGERRHRSLARQPVAVRRRASTSMENPPVLRAL